MTFQDFPVPLDVYRRRLQLRHALATVEAAIALQEETGPCGSETINLEGQREDLIVALWLSQIMLAKH